MSSSRTFKVLMFGAWPKRGRHRLARGAESVTKGASFCSQGDEQKELNSGPKPEQVDSLLRRSCRAHLGHSVLERNPSLTGWGKKAKKNTPLQWDR